MRLAGSDDAQNVEPRPNQQAVGRRRPGHRASTRQQFDLLAEAQLRVGVQADCTPHEALALMRQRARLTDRSLFDIADGVTKHRIWFSL